MGKRKLSLSDAIKHCEEVAEKQEIIAIYTPIEMLSSDVDIEKCQECASEHRQLAEWLRKLKKYEEGIVQIKELINDYKGHDMWDTANGMQLALECLEGSDNK